MAKHYMITIKVAYDEATVPEDLKKQLERNVDRCIQRHDLLNDEELYAVVEEYSAEVTDETAS